MTASALKDTLATTADKARQTAAAAMDAASQAGRTVTAEVKAQAADAVETVRKVSSERADAGRDSLVSAGERLADTLQTQAETSEGMQARVLGGLAGGVTTVTDGLRDRSVADLLASAQAYARRNPGTFAVGAAVAGFALARFLRASSNRLDAQARATEATDRLYRDAARRTVDTLGHVRSDGPRA